MSKKNIILLMFTAVVLFFSCYFLVTKTVIPKLRGDSGFDTSYDSGGSWDSGSSWNSSSSYDSGSSWNGGDSSSSDSSGGDMAVLIFIIIVIVLVIVIIKNPSKTNYLNSNFVNSSSFNAIIKLDHNKELSMSLLKNNGLNYESLIEKLYEIYIDTQIAWMNFDYDKLKENLTDELYNQYVMQLDTLKVKNEKNIMSDFELKDIMFTNLITNNNTRKIIIELLVEFYDYIEKSGKVVRGTNNRKVIQHYEMVFVLDTKENKKCPSCGQDISNLSDNECPSCHSKIALQNNNWKLSKKESIEQSLE